MIRLCVTGQFHFRSIILANVVGFRPGFLKGYTVVYSLKYKMIELFNSICSENYKMRHLSLFKEYRNTNRKFIIQSSCPYVPGLRLLCNDGASYMHYYIFLIKDIHPFLSDFADTIIMTTLFRLHTNALWLGVHVLHFVFYIRKYYLYLRKILRM